MSWDTRKALLADKAGLTPHRITTYYEKHVWHYFLDEENKQFSYWLEHLLGDWEVLKDKCEALEKDQAMFESYCREQALEIEQLKDELEVAHDALGWDEGAEVRK